MGITKEQQLVFDQKQEQRTKSARRTYEKNIRISLEEPKTKLLSKSSGEEVIEPAELAGMSL